MSSLKNSQAGAQGQANPAAQPNAEWLAAILQMLGLKYYVAYHSYYVAS
jgi:hypothetical protein